LGSIQNGTSDGAANSKTSAAMASAMMIAVQLDHPEEFKRLWTWAVQHMQSEGGPRDGYFAWTCSPTGTCSDPNPAPDGEQYFATALFLAGRRWGNGVPPYDFRTQAQRILDAMRAPRDPASGVTPMFDATSQLPVFVPSGAAALYTDPAYVLPGFYEFWAQEASHDNAFWSAAAQAGRAFLWRSAHPVTGLHPDNANFDGTARAGGMGEEHFGSDAWRVASNVAVDYAWFRADPNEVTLSERRIGFFGPMHTSYVDAYSLDGLQTYSPYHSAGLVAMNATAVLAASTTNSHATDLVQDLWSLPIPQGGNRTYNGTLYMLGLLQVSGNFRASW
jgi:oligosaccharide reducing-end xylanase